MVLISDILPSIKESRSRRLTAMVIASFLIESHNELPAADNLTKHKIHMNAINYDEVSFMYYIYGSIAHMPAEMEEVTTVLMTAFEVKSRKTVFAHANYERILDLITNTLNNVKK